MDLLFLSEMTTKSNNPAMAHVPAPIVAQMPTLVVTPVVPAVHYGEKPEKFNGLNFKMWQQKNAVLSDHIEPCEVHD